MNFTYHYLNQSLKIISINVDYSMMFNSSQWTSSCLWALLADTTAECYTFTIDATNSDCPNYAQVSVINTTADVTIAISGNLAFGYCL